MSENNENMETPVVETPVETTEQTSKKERSNSPKNWEVDRLMRYETLIDTVLNVPAAKALASAVGYNETRIKEGQTLVKNAKALVELKNVAQGRAISLTQAYQELKDELHREYMQQLTVVRHELSAEIGLLNILKAKGQRASRFNVWASDLEAFYDNATAHETIKAKLAESVLTEKQLKDSQKKLNVLVALNMDKKQQRNEVKKVTQEKNEAMRQAKDWAGQFQKVLRSAYLRDQVKRTILGI